MKKRLFAIMMSLALVASVGFPAVTAKAEGLTQAESPDQVTYGTVSESDIEVLKSLFDIDYYIAHNQDLVETVGTDYDKLFEHFCKCGVFEGRTCNPNFDPSAYAAAYKDVKAAFGTDIVKYYVHYATVGASENRTITTVEACANAGITVHPLNNESVSITPRVYQISKTLGTTDYAVVAVAVERAEANGGTVVVAPTKDVKDRGIEFDAENYEHVGEIVLEDNPNPSAHNAPEKYGTYSLYVRYTHGGYVMSDHVNGSIEQDGITIGEISFRVHYVDQTEIYKWEEEMLQKNPDRVSTSTSDTLYLNGEFNPEHSTVYVDFQAWNVDKGDYSWSGSVDSELVGYSEDAYIINFKYDDPDSGEERTHTTIEDSGAKADTTYNAYGTFKENEDGTLTLQGAIKNEDTGFYIIKETVIPGVSASSKALADSRQGVQETQQATGGSEGEGQASNDTQAAGGSEGTGSQGAESSEPTGGQD